ncbi:hypothetical protein ACQB60_10460 [Actinomycetota bacterium Odt1-20B]
MGLDMTLLAVDWGRLQEIPPRERKTRLLELDFPDDEGSGNFDRGLVWPVEAGTHWCAEYEFCTGLGSYKPHFWAGEAWDDTREFTAPVLRAAFDEFLDGLIWHDLDSENLDVEGDLFPPWDGNEAVSLLVLCTPQQVAVPARSWSRAVPHLEELREPFALHAAGRSNWMETFDAFASLLRNWGDVMGEAQQRGWGLVGLPY